MAITVAGRDYEKIREDTIQALKLVLQAIENASQVSDASFSSDPEYDDTIKNEGVWLTKYPSGWQNLSISLRYRKQKPGSCCGSGGTNDLET